MISKSNFVIFCVSAVIFIAAVFAWYSRANLSFQSKVGIWFGVVIIAIVVVMEIVEVISSRNSRVKKGKK